VPAEANGTWYPDPGDPTGDSGPHGTISLDDLDARTTTSTSTTSTTRPAAPTTTTRVTLPRRPRRASTTSRARFIAPPYAPNLGASTSPPALPTPLTYTVVTGDCLWTIAAHRLPPTATAAEVDRAWRAIYDANRAVIGSDPNLIRPGQILELPPLPTSA
jgi:nucleoid-associated protein YgaU